MNFLKSYSITVIAFCFIFVSCKKSNSGEGTTPTPPASLAISSISVSSGPFNTNVIITGAGFSSSAAEDQVAFNKKAASVTAATATKLTVVVPKGAGTGDITVTVGSSTVTGPQFTYVLSATVSTFAGNDNINTIDGTGTNASFRDPYAITSDKNGNLYVADNAANVVRKITPDAVVTTLAGSGKPGSADGKGSAASFNELYGITVDSQGNLFVADHENFKVRKITPDGTVTTFAGTGSLGTTDGTGTSASFYGLYAITIDASDNLYVLDNEIRKITPAGLVTTVNSNQWALLGYTGIAVDHAGNIFLTGGQNYQVAEIPAAGGSLTFAGSATKGFANGTGTMATFGFLTAIAVDNSGNLLVADYGNAQIRMITPEAVVTTLAGKLYGGAPTVDGNGDTATFYSLSGVTVDPSGIIYVCEANNQRIRKIVAE